MMNKRQKKKAFDKVFTDMRVDLLVKSIKPNEENLLYSFTSVYTAMLEGRKFSKKGHEIQIRLIDFIV